MNSFWKGTSDGVVFNLFSREHMIALGIIIGIICLIYSKKEKLKKVKERIGYFVGAIIFLQQFFLYYWYIDTGNFTIQESLPLYLCRITAILSIIMVMKRDYQIFEVVYFWGLGGATFALLTPDTGGFLFPHWMWIQFFIGHGGILISIFFMIFVYEYEPTLYSLGKAIKWTVFYVVAVDVVNYLVDANYSYLKSKPKTTTILDCLPQFPYYVFIGMLLIFMVFAFLYLPFFIKDMKKNKIKGIFYYR